jgi:hypothetical protein
MEKIKKTVVKKYQKAILEILNYYAAIQSPFMPLVTNYVLADVSKQHYQLQRMGWYQDRHVHYTVFHFEIRNNQVWVHENRTDVNIDAELIEAGVAPKDIISGLEHPVLVAQRA